MGRVIKVAVLVLAGLAAPRAASGAPRACEIGSSSCGTFAYCAADWQEGTCPRRGFCQPFLPAPNDLVFSLPIPAGERVYCAKGSLKRGNSTHSACDPSTRFAIDLATTADERPHFVLAPADGIARIFGGCTSADLNRQEMPSTCNFGFGNMARVEHAPGLYSQVAHLSSLLVHDGAKVARGDVLGIEGNSGNAGAKHLHFSLHRGSARRLLPGPTLPFPKLRLRTRGAVRTVSASELPCGDFERNPIPDPTSLLESENVIGKRPLARFGFLTRMDELAIAAVSRDTGTRLQAVAELRRLYDEPTAPYWIALAYLRSRDTHTAEEELVRAQRRAERGLGPPWLRPWCLIFLGEVALLQRRHHEARNYFESALTSAVAQDAGLRARIRRGLSLVNAP